ncbi:MAG TPA: OmpA family protein [Saprospiraceae bacterium]|nr:OmpA family protein [Saprospiraceae bacterium]
MRLRLFILGMLIIMASNIAQGQGALPIQLTNPSFEDIPRHSHVPRGWYDCGFPGESPPDTQPDPTFRVSKSAYDGETYLGMVVRDNDTWEAISQKLTRSMDKSTCYELSLYAARSESYVSVSRITDDQANYVTPVKVRIYGGFDYCDKQYLLGETKLIINTRWLEYRIKLEPIANYTHIVIEAFYNTPTLFPYNGNVLLDKLSDLIPVPCEQPIAETTEPPKAPEVKKPPVTPTSPPKTPSTPPTTTPKTPPVVVEKKEEPPVVIENKKISELNRADLKEGSTIRLDNLYFEVNKAVITNGSYAVLDEIYAFLSRNPEVIVEIGGHTNGVCDDEYCNRLSTNRAKAVYDYIVKKGIDKNRLQYKGYGRRQPIADNNTPDGRRKNQRVEIKVLSFNG